MVVDIGGAENYLLTLLPALRQEGIDIHFLCIYHPAHRSGADKMILPLQAAGIRIHLCPYKLIASPFIPLFLWRLINREKYDLVCTNLIYAEVWAAIAHLLPGHRFKLIGIRHGYRDEYVLQHGMQDQPSPPDAYLLLSRLAACRIDANICVSESLKKLLLAKKIIRENNSRVIYLALPENKLPQPSKSALPIIPHPFILFMGRLEPIKGIDRLLRAFAALPALDEKIHLIIAGTGSEEENLRKIAAETGQSHRIHFFGYQPDTERFYSQALFTVAPSKGESFGLVIIEAFCQEKPVIAFDVPALNEIILNEYNGVLVPAYDETALSEAMHRLITDASYRNRLGQQAGMYVRQKFELKKMISKTLACFEEVLYTKKQSRSAKD